MEALLIIIVELIGKLLAATAVPVVEDVISGKVQTPPDSVIEGYVDQDVIKQVQHAVDNPNEVDRPAHP